MKYESIRMLQNFINWRNDLERLEIIPAADKCWVVPEQPIILSDRVDFLLYGIVRYRSHSLKALVNKTPLSIIRSDLSLIIFTRFVLIGKGELIPEIYYVGWMGVALRKLPRNKFALPKLNRIDCTPLQEYKDVLSLSIIEGKGSYKKQEIKGVNIGIIDSGIFKNVKDLLRKGYINYDIVVNIFNELIVIREKILSINVSVGFVKSINIFEYPIIGELAKELLLSNEWLKANNYQKANIYKWLGNILMLEYFTLCTEVLSKLKVYKESYGTVDYEYLLDAKAQMRVLQEWSYSFLDNSIKQHLRVSNPRITSNVVTGFDTEYLPIDRGNNKLLSVQLSISGYVKLFVPLRKAFKFEGVNTLTSETYIKTPPKFDSETLLNIIRFIENLIAKNRMFTHGNHDTYMNQICNSLIENDRNIDHYNRNDFGYIFRFKKESIKNVLILGAEGETLKVNFNTLVHFINEEINMDYQARGVLNRMVQGIAFSTSFVDVKDSRKESASWKNLILKMDKVKEIVLKNEDNTFIDEYEKGNTIERMKMEKLMFGTGEEFKVQFKYEHILYAHYNAADLGMLEDWKEISKGNVDILKKSFVTLKKSIRLPNSERIFLRDTILLSSVAAATLEKIGAAHEQKKTILPFGAIGRMDILLKQNPVLFKQYALNDSFVTLIHALFMNDFCFNLGSLANPITLGTLSRLYLNNKWKDDSYRGYQIDSNYPLGDVKTSITPRGVTSLGPVGDYLASFIGSYRGGRNECFSYGIDTTKTWYDYDLTSCYATIMSMCGNLDYGNLIQELSPAQEEQKDLDRLSEVAIICGTPNYSNIRYLTNKTNISHFNWKNGYSTVRIKFNLPSTVLYPPFPVNLDKNITIYPLSGETTVTGLELLSGANILTTALGMIPEKDRELYYINILDGAFIPFKTIKLDEKETIIEKPFYNVINDLQAKRRQARSLSGKGSAMERIYKDLGNMLYGKVVSGISDKKTFDARLWIMQSTSGSDITNPIIGAYITGFVRSLLAELLQKVQLLGGKVTAVTTDGFVTDIPNLEEKLLENLEEDSFLKQYRDIRLLLSGDPSALEVKTSVRGLIQWTTRGQLSYNHTDPDLNNYRIPIAAMTGFQKYHFTQEENIKNVSEVIGKGNNIQFYQRSLSGALQLYKENENVSMVSTLRKFKTVFDTKRLISNNDGLMNYTLPFQDVSYAALYRTLMNNFKTGIYSEKYSNKLLYSKIPNATMEVIIDFTLLFLNFYKNVNIHDKFQLIEILKRVGIKISVKRLLVIINYLSIDNKVPLNVILNTTSTSKLINRIDSEMQKESKIIPKILNPDFILAFKNRYEHILTKVLKFTYIPPCLALVEIPKTNIVNIINLLFKENLSKETISKMISIIPHEVIGVVDHNTTKYTTIDISSLTAINPRQDLINLLS